MIPLTKKTRLHMVIVGAVVGLGTAVGAPSITVKDNIAEASIRAAIVTSQHNMPEEDTKLSSLVNQSLLISSSNITGDFTVSNSNTSNLNNSNLENENTYNVTKSSEKENNSLDEILESNQATDIEDSIESNEVTDTADSEDLTKENLTLLGKEDSTDNAEDSIDGEVVVDEEPAPKVYTIGVKHSTVIDIQQRLMDLGFMEYAEPTNYYGAITAEAVTMFQRQQDLKQDGILGPETYEMLLSDNAKYYAAKLGMDGSDIKRIQQRLYEMGYLASSDLVTGHFGDVTESAVKKMQENNGLYADGKVGVQTTELLYSGEAKPNLIVYGEKSDIVLASQKRLKELGYLTTTPDGEYGNDTLVAVKQFQSRNDLVVDGFLGPSTRDVLNSSSAVPNGIMLGDNGDAVKRVQELLSKYGYLSSDNTTGYFGEVTENAVKSFQKNNGLTADGNVGVMTMTKLTSGNAVKANSSSSGSSSSSSNNSSSSSSGSSSSNSSSSASSSSSSSGSSSSSSTVSGSVSELIRVAKSKIGSTYVLGAKGPNSFDCSGFIYWCLNQVGVKQSYLTSSGWRNVGKYKKITSLSNVRAGDIIVVKGHVGIAAGNGMVIDASSSSGKIVYRDINSWWSSRFIVAWRIFD